MLLSLFWNAEIVFAIVFYDLKIAVFVCLGGVLLSIMLLFLLVIICLFVRDLICVVL